MRSTCTGLGRDRSGAGRGEAPARVDGSIVCGQIGATLDAARPRPGADHGIRLNGGGEGRP